MSRSRPADYEAQVIPLPLDPQPPGHEDVSWSDRDVKGVAPTVGAHQTHQLYDTQMKRSMGTGSLPEFEALVIVPRMMLTTRVGLCITAAMLLIGLGGKLLTESAEKRLREQQLIEQKQERDRFDTLRVDKGLLEACKKHARAYQKLCAAASTPTAAFERDARMRGLMPACIGTRGSVPPQYLAACAQYGVKK